MTPETVEYKGPMSEFAERRRISFDPTKTQGYGWVMSFKQTMFEFEDCPNVPHIVPSLGLRRDGHAGKFAEGMQYRRVAGFYDQVKNRYYTLDVIPGETDPHPWYEARVWGSNHIMLDSSGYNELGYAFNEFIRNLPEHYQYDEPMKWIKPEKEPTIRTTAKTAPGFGLWA